MAQERPTPDLGTRRIIRNPSTGELEAREFVGLNESTGRERWKRVLVPVEQRPPDPEPSVLEQLGDFASGIASGIGREVMESASGLPTLLTMMNPITPLMRDLETFGLVDVENDPIRGEQILGAAARQSLDRLAQAAQEETLTGRVGRMLTAIPFVGPMAEGVAQEFQESEGDESLAARTGRVIGRGGAMATPLPLGRIARTVERAIPDAPTGLLTRGQRGGFGSNTAQLLEPFSASAPGGGTLRRLLNVDQPLEGNRLADAVMRDIGGGRVPRSAEAVGNTIVDALQHGRNSERLRLGRGYASLRRSMPEVRIDVRSFAKEWLQKFDQRLPPDSTLRRFLIDTSNARGTLGPMDMAEFHEWRTQLVDFIDNAAGDNKISLTSREALMKDFRRSSKQLLKRSMREAGRADGVSILERLDSEWARFRDEFDNTYIGTILTQERNRPEVIVKMFGRGRERAVPLRTLRLIKSKVSKPVWDEAVSRYLIDTALDPARSREMRPAAIASSLDPPSRIQESVFTRGIENTTGDPRLDVMLEPKSRNALREFQDILARQGSTTESLAGQMAQWNIFRAFATGTAVASAGMTVAGNWVISNLITQGATGWPALRGFMQAVDGGQFGQIAFAARALREQVDELKDPPADLMMPDMEFGSMIVPQLQQP